jgi:hypothetical protein
MAKGRIEMKWRLVPAVFLLMVTSGMAKADTIYSMPQQAAEIDACKISRVAILGRNAQQDITVRAVEIYTGQSTDVRPPYRLLITYFNGGEINNTRTAFNLGYFWKIRSFKRLKAGLYQISGTRLIGEAVTQKVIITVDTAQVFIDDRKISAPEFKNPYFSSTIRVTESTP